MEPKESALLIGASRGIGRELALETARRGHRPVSVARTFTRDDKELMEAGPCLMADVASPFGQEYLQRERVWNLPYYFWIAGAYMHSRLAEASDEEIDGALNIYQSALVKTVRGIHKAHLAAVDARMPPEARAQRTRFMLVVIGSISSYKVRKHEAVYAMAKAGQAAFLRTYAAEMAEELPGSRILLVNCARLGSQPGAQKTDSGGVRIDPGFVAKLIWGLVDPREGRPYLPYMEVNVERRHGPPIVSFGPQTPQTF